MVHGNDRFTLRDAIGLEGPEIIGREALGHLQEVAGLQQVLRQPRADSSPHAPDPGAGRQAGPRGQARELLIPASAQLDGQQLSLHVLRARAGNEEGEICGMPGALERGRQRHPRPVQGLPAQAGHRLAGPPGRASCPRITGHLRAAMGLGRLRHVPVDGRGPARPWELLVKDVPEQIITTSTTWSTSLTGRRTSIPSSRPTTTSSRLSAPATQRRGRRQVDRLRNGRRQTALQRL